MTSLGKITRVWLLDGRSITPGWAKIHDVRDDVRGVVLVRSNGSRELIPWHRIESVEYG